MSGKILAWLLMTVLLITCSSAESQQPKKVPLIGYLAAGYEDNDTKRAEEVRLALRQIGYIEGQNLAIEYRYAQTKRERLPELVAELVRLKVDIILALSGDAVIRAAMNGTKTIPIIMTGPVSDPVEAGLVDSLARPGGNVTGITSLSRDLGGKRLELFKEAFPKLMRVAVLYESASPPSVIEVKEILPVAARGLRLTLQSWDVRTGDDFEPVFAAISKWRPDGFYVASGALTSANQKRIIGFALTSRLPSMFGNRVAVETGGLIHYGADEADRYRRVAYFVDRILKGAKPADLPVEQPTKFELVINLKTAKQIGLTIPPNVLARADRVIR
jgi:putative tryptophan/tyrosine transport system substrate-binding protein